MNVNKNTNKSKRAKPCYYGKKPEAWTYKYEEGLQVKLKVMK